MTKWEYSLTQEEEAICARVGFERQEPYLANPKANRNYSMGDVDEIWQHSVAAGSELAFARMIGLTEFVPHVNKWNTEDDVPGFDIRYTFPSEKYPVGLRLHNRDKDHQAYVLLVEGLAVRKKRKESDSYISHPYKAVGWLFAKDGRIPEFEDYCGGWRVPVTRLRSMQELTEAGW